MLRVKRDSRQYARFRLRSLQELPLTAPKVAFAPLADDLDWGDWETGVWLDDPYVEDGFNTREFGVLVAGPDATAGGAVVLASGEYASKVQISDDPELIVEEAGYVSVE